MKKYKIGVIGFGYWGPNIVRNFHNHPDCEVKFICDNNENAINRAQKAYSDIKIVKDSQILFNDNEIDIIAIITPLSSHFNLAKEALEAGKHVFLEKPMTENTEQAKILTSLAKEKNLIGVVDHTFLFTGAVKKIKEIIDSGEIGEIYYFDSVRVNLGIFQNDIDVIWDLAPHDLSILFYLTDKFPIGITANGVDHLNNGLVDGAYLTLHYENKMIANFHVNWLSPVKIRRILIAGSKKMIVYDDMELSEKVKIYDKGIMKSSLEDIHQLLVDYRSGSMLAPNISTTEALKTEIDDFIISINNKNIKPINNFESGSKIVSILEKSKISLNNNIIKL